MKKSLFMLVFLMCTMQTIFPQSWKWFDPINAEYPIIQNQGFTNELGKSYHRLPNRAQNVVREKVWNLSKSSTGLAIHFYSDAPQIKIKYQVTGPLCKSNMATTGVSGIDLYRIDSDGIWDLCSGNYFFEDTIVYSFQNFPRDQYHNKGFEYRIYLPLYNEIRWLKIGVPENSLFKFIPLSDDRPIVIYGTSIVQGASASRPGMAWSNIIQRRIDYPVINMGFYGNGLLEKEVISFINEIDAQLYVLDCIPNLTGNDSSTILERIKSAVHQIRSLHKTPILLLEHAGYSNMKTDTIMCKEINQANEYSLQAFQELQSEGIKDIYYLSKDELKFSVDAWTDCVHPNDFGMLQQANAVEDKIRKILHIPTGNIITTKPVTQRRNLKVYEWRKRHHTILKAVQQKAPKCIILGNSIIHFWGGFPADSIKNGLFTWKKVMKPAGFFNMGYGWDKIENVLWRIYHGELDGYSPEKIIVMIGTNNLEIDSDKDLVEGLYFLLREIRFRQPNSKITMIGILPCRGMEEHVRLINLKIRDMAKNAGFDYKDIGNGLLLKNGKINENLFVDGLHPNDRGYSIIAPLIVK